MGNIQAFTRKVNILIVEGSSPKVPILSMILKQKGYKVRNALSGELAMQSARENLPDIILLDINTPDMDGYQVCELIKADETLKEISIVFISTYNEPIDKIKVFAVGGVDFITMPYNDKEVLTRVETHLKLHFMQRFNKELIKINSDLKSKVLERNQQLEETTVALKEFNVMLDEEINERTKREEEIIYISYHDKLTGLYNRRFYEEEIKRLDTERNLPISIIMGDVNGLKIINDAFGHDKGDELLQKAAVSIRSACRKDDIAARWGGDEFVILLPKTKTEEAEGIVKRIKDLYLNEYVNAIHVSISFGWDTKRKIDEDILKVLKGAEDHMYKHKIIENEGMRGNIISTIINTLHEKNPREELHSKRVSEICQNIGKAIGFSETGVNSLKVAGLLHDIGKIAIEEGILNKPGKLTELERNEIQRHPDIGYRILSSSNDMLELANCILAHHERWDGTGYPKGLKGEDIPITARIIAIADTYDAMTSARPYREALSEEKAFLEIHTNAGTQFDPAIAKIFAEKVLGKRWD